MNNKRLHKAARELHISSEALLKLLRSLGFRVKGYTSFVSDEMMAACKRKMEEDKKFLKAQDRKRERIRTKRKEEREKRKERKSMERKRATEKVKETLVKIETKERAKKKKPKPLKLEEEKVETRKIRVSELTAVRELAQMLDTEPLDLIAKCLELGLFVTINQRLDFDTVATIADEYGYETELIPYYVEEEVKEEEKGEEIVRPPIVTVMGHVDHGKTSLLDNIRKTNVTQFESGGITQHIGAYEIEFKGQKITFIDTPGHEAFTAMRARGAQVTDIAVLVVAADDGVMPQTVESINHAKDAGIPMIVAINKIDLPNTEPEKTKQELLQENVRLEEYGGDVPVCLTSAKTGEGIPELLETILIQADLLELTTTKEGLTKGTIIESKMDKGKGIVATVLVLQGSLRKGDAFIAGITSGKVRAMYDEWRMSKEYCEPGVPVQVVGFDKLPNVGDSFVVVKDEKKAREISKNREIAIKEQMRREKKIVTLEGIQKELAAGEMKEFKIIIKGDVAGSVEAISDSLEKLLIKNIMINVIHKGIGSINESDVLLAKASGAIIIGYHVKANPKAKDLADMEGIDIRTYDIIYKAIDEIKMAMEGLLEPEYEEKEIGKVEVRRVFRIPQIGFIAGAYVVSGKVSIEAKARIQRGDEVYEEEIAALKRFKEDVKEVGNGLECGIKFKGELKPEEGDIITVYELIRKN